MGFSLAQVLSDGHHYSPFVCSLCQNLCSIGDDSALVTRCSHVFCKACLNDHIQFNSNCPTCQINLNVEHEDKTGDGPAEDSGEARMTMKLGQSLVFCQLLQESQPIAYRLLAQIQVACIDRTNKRHCEWTGSYSDYAVHLPHDHPGSVDASVVAGTCSSPRLRASPVSPMLKHKFRQQNHGRPSLAGLRSLSDPSLSRGDHLNAVVVTSQENQHDEIDEDDEDDEDDDDESVLLSPLKPVRNLLQTPTSHSFGNRIALEGLQSLPSPSLSKDDEDIVYDMGEPDQTPNRPARPPVTPEPFRKSLSLSDVQKGVEGLSSKTSPSDLALFMNNASIATAPDARKGSTTPIRSEAPPRMVQRTISDDGSLARPEDRKFAKIVEKKKRKKSNGSNGANNGSASEFNDSDLDVSYSQATDWNMSINSLGGWQNTSTNEPIPMETLAEESEAEFDLQFEPDSTTNNNNNNTTASTIFSTDTKKLFEKAEKLKKQANAKFNKGDFAASRTLYTEGIGVMSGVKAITVEERELLSNMYSNRAVTFFREKKFESCIEDCDKALVFVPTYDKSWIRKWRALMALGNIPVAHACLEAASRTVPDSQRILEEFGKCQGDKSLLEEAESFIEKGEYEKAREALKPYARNTENIGLLLISARADAALGLTESALEKVNKALRFNPMHTEGLEIRGHVLFLSGETEKGAHLLQEAYVRNKDKKTVRSDLIRCQKTHSAATKGRSCVKRGRYFEAVDHFSTSIRESGDVPQKAPLFGILRTERAEAFLLSKSYAEALRDCDDVLNAQNENASAYSVRAEILIALGKADDAKEELEKIRSSWGTDNPTIDEAFRRVDFELRVLKADDELMSFVKDLENGRVDFSDTPKTNRSPSRRKLGHRSKSRKSLDGDNVSLRNDKDGRAKGGGRTKDDRVSSADTAGRRRADSGARAGRRSLSKSKLIDHRTSEKGESLTNASRLGSMVEINGVEEVANEMEYNHGSNRDLLRSPNGKDSRRRPALEKQGESERLLMSDRRRPPLEKLGESDRRLLDRRRPMLEKQGESDRGLVERRSRRSASAKLKVLETVVTS